VGFIAGPTFADIDDDGDLDAFVGGSSSSGNTTYFQNTGSASAPAFAAAVVNPFGLAAVDFTSAPTFGDVNGDGDLDALIGSEDGDLVFFENTGTAAAPAFAAAIVEPFGLDFADPFYNSQFENYASPTLVDIDGDGDLDAFVGEEYGYLLFYRNRGSSAAPSFVSPTKPFNLTSPYSLTIAPALVDIEGDGDLDLFAGDYGGQTRFFANTGSATQPIFAAPANNPFGLPLVDENVNPTFADIDGDGDPDFFAGDSGSAITFAENTGSVSAPAFASGLSNPFGLASVGFWLSMAFADLDADGDRDVLIGEENGNLNYAQNTGTALSPAFAAPIADPFGLSNEGSFSWPALADLDGDGDLDAVVGTDDGFHFFFLENTGSAAAPAFAAPVEAAFGLAEPAPVFNGYGTVAFGDIDGDGDLDAFVGNAYGTVFFFENEGDPTGPTPTPTMPGPSPTPTATPSPTGPPGPDPIPACPATPASGCATVSEPQGSLLLIVDRPSPDGDGVRWKLKKGAATDAVEFGDPTQSTSYVFCIYDDEGSGPELAAQAGVAGGGVCGDQPCWRASGNGERFKYRDRAGAANGITGLKLIAGPNGKAKIMVAIQGANAVLPDLPLSQTGSVHAQIINSIGECWTANYDAPSTINRDDKFKDQDD
jgi:hypothetical protein